MVKLGVYGDNKMFKPASLRGYHDCLSKMGNEGIRGLYKGNFFGALFSLINAKLKTESYNYTLTMIESNNNWKTNLLST